MSGTYFCYCFTQVGSWVQVRCDARSSATFVCLPLGTSYSCSSAWPFFSLFCVGTPTGHCIKNRRRPIPRPGGSCKIWTTLHRPRAWLPFFIADALHRTPLHLPDASCFLFDIQNMPFAPPSVRRVSYVLPIGYHRRQPCGVLSIVAQIRRP